MKVTTESVGGCRRVLRVEVEAATVDAEYQKVLKEFAAAASVPGFRKGRAPAPLIERRYGAEVVEETRSRLLPQFYHEALRAENLSPVAVVEVKDVVLSKGHPLSFAVTVDVPPVFTLPAYKNLEIEEQAVAVADEDVQRTIDALRSQAATFVDLSGKPVEEGHLVQVDYLGTCEGKPVVEWVPRVPQVGKATDFWMQAGSGGGAFIPGLAEGVVGASIGETRTVAVEFPGDYRVSALAGRKAEYAVTIKAVRERKLPEMDAAFLKSLQVDSVEALKENVRKGMRHEAEREEQNRRKNAIVKQLLDRTTMELPESIVQEESRRIIQDIVSNSTARGVSRETIVDQRDGILNHATRTSQERVKSEYILDAIAEAEKIDASDEEVGTVLSAMASRHGVDGARLRREMERRGAIERVRRDLRIQKALDFVAAQAKVKGK